MTSSIINGIVFSVTSITKTVSTINFCGYYTMEIKGVASIVCCVIDMVNVCLFALHVEA